MHILPTWITTLSGCKIVATDAGTREEEVEVDGEGVNPIGEGEGEFLPLPL